MNDSFNTDHEVQITFLGCAELTAQTIDNIESRAEVLTAIALKHTDSGQVEAGVELLETINDAYLRDQALAELAARCVHAGAAAHADEVAERIEEDATYVTATENMAVAYAETGDVEKGLELAEKLTESELALSRIALVCAAADKSSQALALAQSIDYPDLKAPVLIELAAKALPAGRRDEAVALLDEVTAVADEIEYFEQQISTLVTIAALEYQAEREDQALEILTRAHELASESVDDLARDGALAQIAVALAELQQYERADKIIEEIENPFHFAHATLRMAIEYHKTGNFSQSLTLLTQALEIVRDEEVYGAQSMLMREGLLGELALGQATVGHYEEALQTVGLMNSEEQQNRSLGNISLLAVTSGNQSRLFEVTELVKDPYARILIEVEVIDVLIDAAQTELADHTLAQAHARIAEITRAYQKSMALMKVASRFVRREQNPKAAELLFAALGALALIEGPYLQSKALIELAAKYSEHGVQPGHREQQILEEITRKLN